MMKIFREPESQGCLQNNNNNIPTKYPTQCEDLAHTEKEDTGSVRGVVVKQLERVHPTLEPQSICSKEPFLNFLIHFKMSLEQFNRWQDFFF